MTDFFRFHRISRYLSVFLIFVLTLSTFPISFGEDDLPHFVCEPALSDYTETTAKVSFVLNKECTASYLLTRAYEGPSYEADEYYETITLDKIKNGIDWNGTAEYVKEHNTLEIKKQDNTSGSSNTNIQKELSFSSLNENQEYILFLAAYTPGEDTSQVSVHRTSFKPRTPFEFTNGTPSPIYSPEGRPYKYEVSIGDAGPSGGHAHFLVVEKGTTFIQTRDVVSGDGNHFIATDHQNLAIPSNGTVNFSVSSLDTQKSYDIYFTANNSNEDFVMPPKKITLEAEKNRLVSATWNKGSENTLSDDTFSISFSKDISNAGETSTLAVSFDETSSDLFENADINFSNSDFEIDSISEKQILYRLTNTGIEKLKNFTGGHMSFKVNSGSGIVPQPSLPTNSVYTSVPTLKILGHTLSDDSFLSYISVSGSAISNFSKENTTYNISVSQSVKAALDNKVDSIIAYEPSDENASVSVSIDFPSSGIFTIAVTAENGASKTTYTVNYSVEPSHSEDSFLSYISVSGSAISNFSKENTTYNIPVSQSVKTALDNKDDSIISYKTSDENASASVDFPSSGVFTVTVTSKTGLSQTVYTVNYSHDTTIPDGSSKNSKKDKPDTWIGNHSSSKKSTKEDSSPSNIPSGIVIEKVSPPDDKIQTHKERILARSEKILSNLTIYQKDKPTSKTAKTDKSVENIVEKTIKQIGNIQPHYELQKKEDHITMKPDTSQLIKQIETASKQFEQLKDLSSAYYGKSNVRNFGLNVSLDFGTREEKHFSVPIDQDIVNNLFEKGVNQFGIRLKIAELTISPKDLQGDSPASFEMTFSEKPKNIPENGFVKGYSVEVNLSASGQKKDVLTTPGHLTFYLDNFDFGDKVSDDTLSIFRYDKQSKIWKPVGGVYDPLTRTISTRRIHLSQYTVMRSNKSFSDVENSWAKSEINALLNKGVIKEEKGFSPKEDVSRKEFASWLTKAYGLEKPSSKLPFGDVSQESAYYQQLASGYDAGLFSGKANNRFEPDSAMTRQEMAVLIGNALTNYDEKKFNKSLQAKLDTFSDVSQTDSWAKESLAFAIELNLLPATEAGLDPKGKVSKELAASILKKIYG